MTMSFTKHSPCSAVQRSRVHAMAHVIFNNYWMRLSGISRIIEAEVDANRGLNNFRYPAKTEFNNYFIIHMDCFIIHMDHFIIHMGLFQNNDLNNNKEVK